MSQSAVLLGTLSPVFVLILGGFLARRSGFLPEAFWPPMERLTYYCLFPAFLVEHLARADLAGLNFVPMTLALTVPVLLASALLLALRPLFRFDGPAFTSVLQGAIRPNTFVGIAAARVLFDAPGLAVYAIGMATVVPLVNTLSVAALQRFGSGRGGGPAAVLAGLARNPIVLSVIAGIAVNLALPGGLPAPVSATLRVVGDASLAMGLLAVGAGLARGGMADHAGSTAGKATALAVAVSSAAKLVLMPLLTIALAGALGLAGMPLGVAALFSAVPGASFSYILARQMGGDHRLMARIITVETLVAALTMPAVLSLVA